MHTQSYGCIHSAYADHLRILIVRTHVPFPPCIREVANVSRGPKVTRESIEEMAEMVRENRSLYDPTRADHMDATTSNNIWHSIPQSPITCSMFPALFSETRRPIQSHHSSFGSVNTDVQALYTRPGLWVVFQMPLRTVFHGCMETHFTDADADERYLTCRYWITWIAFAVYYVDIAQGTCYTAPALPTE